MKPIKASWLALLLAVDSQAAVTLSNVAIAQREGTRLVDIYYDAINPAGSSLSAFVAVSNNDERVEATAFSGDVGGNVSEGSGLHIVWDGGADLPGVATTDLSITLSVSDPVPAGVVLIPAGANTGNDPDFGPYSLTVDAFYMDATETTKAEWDAVANASPLINASDGKGKAPNHPVQDTTWYEAVKWCNARSAMEGLTACYNLSTWSCNFNANGYRLPTEEEWEYAARGGLSSKRYPWGNQIDHTNANYYSTYYDEHHPSFSNGGYPYTSPVAYFEPNGLGLYDMAGNVWEWCWDSLGTDKVSKGGSWDSWEIEQRCGHRGVAHPSNSGNILGFRTVRNASVAETHTEILVFDSRDYALAVASAHGSPVPAVGVFHYAWKSAVTCSVDAVVLEGGTNFTCTGWIGSGSVPASGDGNHVVVVLEELDSSIEWQWANDDTDSDGMDDAWETAFFGGLGQSAATDYDHDGQNNGDEYIAGTNPTNAASLFQLQARAVPAGFIIEWPAASNRTYDVFWTPNLVYIGFEAIETNLAFPRHSATATLHSAEAQGFFRVDVKK